jgi:hypothetical protein
LKLNKKKEAKIIELNKLNEFEKNKNLTGVGVQK